MSLNRLAMAALAKNQNNHRLTLLRPLETIDSYGAVTISTLIQSRGDRAHQAAGVLLWALLSHSKSVAVVGADDLDKLIGSASEIVKERLSGGPFKVRSKRGKSTVYAQMIGFLVTEGFMRVIKPQQGNAPGVIEVVENEWFERGLLPQPTDESRIEVINSTSKTKFSSYNAYETSKSDKTCNTHDTNKTYNTTILTRHSEHQSELEDAQQNEQQNSVSKLDF